MLGTLRGRARARFERLVRSDRGLADAVRAWEERLLPLAEGLPPVTPPPRVWTAILARIDGSAAVPGRLASRGAGVGWWRGSRWRASRPRSRWRWCCFKPAPELPQGALVVVLAGQDAKPALLVVDRPIAAAISPSPQSLRLRLPDDRALELWMLPEHGNPRSLGLVSAVAPAGIARIALPAKAEQALQGHPGPGGQPGTERRVAHRPADRTRALQRPGQAPLLAARPRHGGAVQRPGERRLAALERVAVGAVFHLPAGGMQFAAQAIGFGPLLAPRAPPRAPRPARARPRGSTSCSGCHAASPRPKTRSKATSVALRGARAASSPRSSSHASASARGRLRSSLISAVKRSR